MVVDMQESRGFVNGNTALALGQQTPIDNDVSSG